MSFINCKIWSNLNGQGIVFWIYEYITKCENKNMKNEYRYFLE